MEASETARWELLVYAISPLAGASPDDQGDRSSPGWPKCSRFATQILLPVLDPYRRNIRRVV